MCRSCFAIIRRIYCPGLIRYVTGRVHIEIFAMTLVPFIRHECIMICCSCTRTYYCLRLRSRRCICFVGWEYFMFHEEYVHGEIWCTCSFFCMLFGIYCCFYDLFRVKDWPKRFGIILGAEILSVPSLGFCQVPLSSSGLWVSLGRELWRLAHPRISSRVCYWYVGMYATWVSVGVSPHNITLYFAECVCFCEYTYLAWCATMLGSGV